MKPSMLYEALLALIGECVPLYVWGACGVGKSQIVSQVADELDYEFLDVRAVQLDPIDLRGLPRIAGDSTEWVPPRFLPTSGRGILFLDELTAAPQITQAGCYQLVLDRRLGEYRLPDDWVVLAAGNPASERGVHFSMLPDGRVLMVGGQAGGLFGTRITSTQIYDPRMGRFFPGPELNENRFKLSKAVVSLKDGRVLIAGGAEQPEIYDPNSDVFVSVSGAKLDGFCFSTATLLNDGRVLLAGGYAKPGGAGVNHAWLYQP